MSVGAYDLTTIAKAKALMRISGTGDDSLIQTLVTAVSDRIERLVNRKLKARDFYERYNGTRNREIRLRQWPVNRVSRFSFGNANAISVTATGAIVATISANEQGVWPYAIAANGTESSTLLEYSTELSASDLVDEINDRDYFSASLVANCPSRYLNPIGGTDCLNRTVHLTWSDDGSHDYYVDHDRGLVQYTIDHVWPDSAVPRTAKGFQNYLVVYNAGYTTIPTDLEMICNEMVQELYQRTKRDISVQSESIGDYSYTLAQASADGLKLTDSQVATLRRYAEIR